MIEPPVVFNMDLANGPTSKRFCQYVATMLGEETDVDDPTFADEFVSDEVDSWTSELETRGYYVWWSCGDVVVYDTRGLSEEDREQFYSEMEDM